MTTNNWSAGVGHGCKNTASGSAPPTSDGAKGSSSSLSASKHFLHNVSASNQIICTKGIKKKLDLESTRDARKPDDEIPRRHGPSRPSVLMKNQHSHGGRRSPHGQQFLGSWFHPTMTGVRVHHKRVRQPTEGIVIGG